MAKPITHIERQELTEEELKSQALEQLMDDLSNHSDGLKQGMALLQELHDSGILEIMVSLIQSKEKVSEIAVDQIGRPPVTNTINTVTAVAGALSEIEPDTTKKLVKSLSNGMAKAEESLKTEKKVGLLDLYKMSKDPDINRSLVFGLNLLKGIGEGLRE